MLKHCIAWGCMKTPFLGGQHSGFGPFKVNTFANSFNMSHWMFMTNQFKTICVKKYIIFCLNIIKYVPYMCEQSMYFFSHLFLRAWWISANCNKIMDGTVILLSGSDEIICMPKNIDLLQWISPHPIVHSTSVEGHRNLQDLQQILQALL